MIKFLNLEKVYSYIILNKITRLIELETNEHIFIKKDGENNYSFVDRFNKIYFYVCRIKIKNIILIFSLKN